MNEVGIFETLNNRVFPVLGDVFGYLARLFSMTWSEWCDYCLPGAMPISYQNLFDGSLEWRVIPGSIFTQLGAPPGNGLVSLLLLELGIDPNGLPLWVVMAVVITLGVAFFALLFGVAKLVLGAIFG